MTEYACMRLEGDELVAINCTELKKNENKMQMPKQLSEEALQITEKRKAKGKGGKERYTYLKA